MQRPLGTRKAAVLRAVVRDYIRTAEPVGSGAIAQRYRLGVSSATIRNEMAALEEQGYVRQPHTSAGRVPTDLGYRFYVDTLPARPRLSDAHERAIDTFFDEAVPDVEEIVRRTAQLLSKLTHYAAVALGPPIERSKVVRAELVAVGSAALLLVVTDTGRIDKRVIERPGGIPEDIVRSVTARLESSFAGLDHVEAADRAGTLAGEGPASEREVLEAIADAFRHMREDPQPVFLGGVANLAAEFEKRDAVVAVFEALESDDAIPSFLRDLTDRGEDVAVGIGHENPWQAMSEASVVVTTYTAGGRPAGTIAIIGPTRMTYPTAISAVRAVAGRLSGIIDSIAG